MCRTTCVLVAAAGLLIPCIAVLAGEMQPPITLSVDASEASRQILQARLAVPAKPGRLTLV